ncbi:hypothetical protein PR048_001256 [Dryococelus australis]|uniref:Uncharacterized protein n=1 Tax=Dryococelus australis TaxID=614101 RepID=A0ABQ9IGX7_9NEOP|nr:hypothetical protein PR048_001256 [Dryococelus australis]
MYFHKRERLAMNRYRTRKQQQATRSIAFLQQESCEKLVPDHLHEILTHDFRQICSRRAIRLSLPPFPLCYHKTQIIMYKNGSWADLAQDKRYAGRLTPHRCVRHHQLIPSGERPTGFPNTNDSRPYHHRERPTTGPEDGGRRPCHSQQRRPEMKTRGALEGETGEKANESENRSFLKSLLGMSSRDEVDAGIGGHGGVVAKLLAFH